MKGGRKRLRDSFREEHFSNRSGADFTDETGTWRFLIREIRVTRGQLLLLMPCGSAVPFGKLQPPLQERQTRAPAAQR